MKTKLVFSLLSLMMLVSCGPMSYLMRVELRYPSKSGLELGNKTFSVAYLDDGKHEDSLFIASVADGFAQRLESEYFGGEMRIPVYNVEKNPGGDYSSRDSVLNILMETGSDVVFVFDSPDISDISLSAPQKVGSPAVRDSAYLVKGSMMYSLALYVYDSMNKDDRVLVFTGTATGEPVAYTDGNETDRELEAKMLSSLEAPGREAGRTAGGQFLPRWNAETLSFMYYDTGSSDWLDAIMAAYDYRWDDAIAIWLGKTDTGNLERRSCAAYNLAVAFYVIGQYGLAEEWLDVSDAGYPLHDSYELRKKIEAKKGD